MLTKDVCCILTSFGCVINGIEETIWFQKQIIHSRFIIVIVECGDWNLFLFLCANNSQETKKQSMNERERLLDSQAAAHKPVQSSPIRTCVDWNDIAVVHSMNSQSADPYDCDWCIRSRSYQSTWSHGRHRCKQRVHKRCNHSAYPNIRICMNWLLTKWRVRTRASD